MPRFNKIPLNKDMTHEQLIRALNMNLDNIHSSEKYGTDTITPTQIVNRTRRVDAHLHADEASGAVSSHNEGPEVAFTGTPTGYARGWCIVPNDYVPGTDIAIKLMTRSTAVNSTETTRVYVGCHSDTDSWAAWNVVSSSAGSHSWATDTVDEITIYTIDSANIAAGDYITFAWRVETAISGTVYVTAASIEYTADS